MIPYVASRGISEALWGDMCQVAQAAAERCAATRADLKKIGVLTFGKISMTPDEAATHGVEVLFAPKSVVELGLFSVPGISNIISVGPKGT